MAFCRKQYRNPNFHHFFSPTHPRNHLELELKQERERRLQNSRSIPGKGSQKPEPKMVMFVIPLFLYYEFQQPRLSVTTSYSFICKKLSSSFCKVNTGFISYLESVSLYKAFNIFISDQHTFFSLSTGVNSRCKQSAHELLILHQVQVPYSTQNSGGLLMNYPITLNILEV